MASGATKTAYDIIVLGSSMSSTVPAFLSNPIYANEVARWNTTLSQLNLRSALFDLFLGLVLNMTGITALNSISLPTLDAAVEHLTAASIPAFQAAVEEAVASLDLYAPIKYAYNLLQGQSISGEATEFLDDVFVAYEYLLKAGNAAAAARITEPQFGLVFRVGLKSLFGAISGAALVLGVIDFAAGVKDLGSSDRGDLWSATVVLPTIKITPSSVIITPGSSAPTEFTASLPAGITGAFKWSWTLTGGVAAQLTDEEGHTGTNLVQIASTTAYLLTTPQDVNPMTVTVEAFSISSSGAATSIGAAKATISSGGSYTLSGPNNGPIVVDDHLNVNLNGKPIYVDPADASAGYRSPITFNANPGDQLEIIVLDEAGYYSGLSECDIHTPSGQTMELTPGFEKQTPGGQNNGVQFDKTFTLP